MKGLDKVMIQEGFRKVKYPIGKPKDKKTMDWYVKIKVPYSSSINKKTLIKIINKLEE